MLTFPLAKLKLKKSFLINLNLYRLVFIFSVNENQSAIIESSTNSDARLTKKLKTAGSQPTTLNLGCSDKTRSLPANPSNSWIVTCPKCDVEKCFVKGGISKKDVFLHNIVNFIYHPNTDVCCSGIHAGVVVSYIWFVYYVAVLQNKSILNL